MNILPKKLLLADLPYVFKLPSYPLTNKNQHVETLRGMAIILVVLGHMIGIDSTGGMRVSDDSVYRYLYYTLEYVRLPLFTVISGWVYANKPVQASNSSRFLKGKFRRLLIPMFVLTTLMFLFRMVIPGTNTTPEISALPRNLIFPYDVYWYLYALFVIFVTISILDTRAFFHRFQGWALTLGGAFVFLYISETFLDPIPNFFTFKGAAYLFPFFLLGIGIYRFKEIILNDKTTLPLLVIFATAVVIQQVIWFKGYPLQEKYSALGLTVGLSGVLLLFRLRLKNDLLTWIGGYAYGIFLFHVFFTGGSRIILSKLGVENQVAMLILGVLIAIFASILIVSVIQRSSVLRFWFLGLRRHEK